MDVAGTDLSGIFESFGNMYNTYNNTGRRKVLRC